MTIQFQDIIGQDKAKSIISKAIERSRVAHAYLFKGPAGVGKKVSALALSILLNCEKHTRKSSCGTCGPCRKIASGNHPDIINIEPDGSMIKINQIRQLKKDLYYPPFEAKCRVIIIADLHQTMPRKEVANSLLKILEEPPADTVFILTVDESALLPTIISRCQVIPFYSLPYETVAQVLVESGTPQDVAYTAAAITEGSIGRAKILADKEFLDLRRTIIESLSGLKVNDPLAVEILFSLAEKAAKLKNDLYEFIELLKLWLKDLMIVAVNGAEELLVNHDLKHIYSKVKERWNLSELSDKVHSLNQAQKEIARNCNKTAVCEVLFYELIR